MQNRQLTVLLQSIIGQNERLLRLEISDQLSDVVGVVSKFLCGGLHFGSVGITHDHATKRKKDDKRSNDFGFHSAAPHCFNRDQSVKPCSTISVISGS